MFEIVKRNESNSFYSVKNEMIKKAEENMGVFIPKALQTFFLEVGYGFLESKKSNVNRLMGPSSISEFRLMIGQFENSEIAEEFKIYSSDKLVFFEVNESMYLSIGITKNNAGKIFYYDDLIAVNLEEFLKKYTEKEGFFLE